MKMVLWMLLLGALCDARAVDLSELADTVDEIVEELFAQDAAASFAAGDYGIAHDKYLWLAQRGNASAQYALGLIHEESLGVPRDYRQALRWYYAAAQQDHGLAQAKLARMYLLGWGVPKDAERAYAWLYLAARHGDEAYRDSLDRLAALLTEEQIVSAHESAQEWVRQRRLE